MSEEKQPYKAQWTTKELAKEAGVTQSYIRQLLIDGTIDGYKLGRDWVVPNSEAQKWLSNRGK